MTPFETTQLSDEALNDLLRKIFVPNWCGCQRMAMEGDYDCIFWVCAGCHKSTEDDNDFVDNHIEFDYADFVIEMLEEMQPTITQFDGPKSGWVLIGNYVRKGSGNRYNIEYAQKDMLTSGAGKTIFRAVAEAYLQFRSAKDA